MARPVSLFTGQWADLPLAEMARKTKEFGYNCIELACWGDHFEPDKALKDKNYCKSRWDILNDNKLTAFAISSHLVGQAICDNIDERHKLILPPDVWGDGDPALSKLLNFIMIDERCHYDFYLLVTRLYLEQDRQSTLRILRDNARATKTSPTTTVV